MKSHTVQHEHGALCKAKLLFKENVTWWAHEYNMWTYAQARRLLFSSLSIQIRHVCVALHSIAQYTQSFDTAAGEHRTHSIHTCYALLLICAPANLINKHHRATISQSETISYRRKHVLTRTSTHTHRHTNTHIHAFVRTKADFLCFLDIRQRCVHHSEISTRSYIELLGLCASLLAFNSVP